ncbi:Pentatricopeptide repeat-containing protein [Platanthera guangdongensis]|uniref:Pentatricopeptide repeat-containing protein n=1 Tax=Platanthera guangdongensis TaxID=2320717 RepID=A0ABR2LVE2_9ASPA
MQLARLLRAAVSPVSASSAELLPPWIPVAMRSISASSSTNDSGDARGSRGGGSHTLGRRLLSLIYPKRSAVIALRKWADEGKSIQKYQLNRVVRELRKYKRFKHALEICEWMRSETDIKLLPGDYAVHLDLIAKVRGLSSAEKFFEDLPDGMKTQSTATALLHIYAQNKIAAKAESLFQQMSSNGFLTCSLPYNHMLTLYASTGELKKIPEVIKQLKKNASPNEFTYNIWLTSCAEKGDLEGAEEAMADMVKHKVAGDRVTFSILANIYIKSGDAIKARDALQKMEIRVSRKDRAAFCYLISMYTALSDVENVRRIWRKMKMMFRKLCDAEYKSVLTSLLKFDLADEAERIYAEWESAPSPGTRDSRVSNALIAYYAKNDMNKAEEFYERVTGAGIRPNYSCWESLALGYLRSNKMEKVLRCLKEALSSLTKWEPNAELVRSVFEGLETAGDAEGGERFLVMLRDAGYVTTEIYNCLLRTYARSQTMPLIVGERMKRDGVAMDEETERLLELTSKFRVGSSASLFL